MQDFAEKLGYVKTSNNGYVSKNGIVEVWKHDDSGEWWLTASELGFEVEHGGYPYAMLAIMASKQLIPSESEARVLVRETFDSMSDVERLSLVQELNFEHGNCFEWSEVMPIGDFLEGLSRNELVRVAVFGDLHNETDPVRYDKYGDAEQVSYQDLYSEICENEDEILDCLINVLWSGTSIFCTNIFDQLGDAIQDGTWRDWMGHDELQQGQEVRV